MTSTAWGGQSPPSARGREEPPRPRRRPLRPPQPGTRAVTWARARLPASRASRPPLGSSRLAGRAAQAHRQVGGAARWVGGSRGVVGGAPGAGQVLRARTRPLLPGSLAPLVRVLGGNPGAEALCDLQNETFDDPLHIRRDLETFPLSSCCPPPSRDSDRNSSDDTRNLLRASSCELHRGSSREPASRMCQTAPRSPRRPAEATATSPSCGCHQVCDCTRPAPPSVAPCTDVQY